ncbi:hypothetical protein [Actinobaculum sp. 352]|uniref:hypothetical protein n=1 Tax=Actinobaculum sp. 352 TaxID=2490946 RepID=UPI000F7F8D00|nr:hypothetical protein [Actinobaculum sp. 352]RTE47728.1 hypothetical protein EKN07_12120 [Actinobaculum sp. 352]
MGFTGWTGEHTGLPSLRVVGPCTVTTAGRTVVTVPAGQTRHVSDPLAVPGANTYTDGATVTVIDRQTGRPWEAILTDATGRGLHGLILANNQDPISWASEVVQTGRHVARWPLTRPPATGTSVIVLTDPTAEPELIRICQTHTPVIIGPAVPTVGVPIRHVVITSITRSRLGPAGTIQVEIAWTQIDPSSKQSAAPVVTWGEYAAATDGWTTESYEDLCRRIGGMP